MPTFLTDVARDRELDGTETSEERFDRLAFAERAVALLKPANMRVAIAEGRSRVVVEAGRTWGRPGGGHWAMLCVPPMASRRAIAVAVAALAGAGAKALEPYVLDALVAEGPYR
ncbi:MAG TPA: hypothetical protein VGI39_17735 [Polyangiaceae bacterium]|jgi:hypothetical protein